MMMIIMMMIIMIIMMIIMVMSSSAVSWWWWWLVQQWRFWVVGTKMVSKIGSDHRHHHLLKHWHCHLRYDDQRICAYHCDDYRICDLIIDIVMMIEGRGGPLQILFPLQSCSNQLTSPPSLLFEIEGFTTIIVTTNTTTNTTITITSITITTIVITKMTFAGVGSDAQSSRSSLLQISANPTSSTLWSSSMTELANRSTSSSWYSSIRSESESSLCWSFSKLE